MLTEEQIKNLNPGDNLALSYPLIFCEYDSEHDELIAKNNGECICFHADDVELPSEHGTTLSRRSSAGAETEAPTPKYNPCRLFREGDEVRVVERYGREMPFCNYINSGEVYTVARDERDGIVALFTCDGIDCTSWYWLELVTPVEELEPYSIDPANTNVIFKCGKKFATFEDDDEAQELCDRLNAEWRKEHGND